MISRNIVSNWFTIDINWVKLARKELLFLYEILISSLSGCDLSGNDFWPFQLVFEGHSSFLLDFTSFDRLWLVVMTILIMGLVFPFFVRDRGKQSRSKYRIFGRWCWFRSVNQSIAHCKNHFQKILFVKYFNFKIKTVHSSLDLRLEFTYHRQKNANQGGGT